MTLTPILEREIDTSNLAPQFEPYLHTGQRIRVQFSTGEVLTGRVGISTGWRPIYLLMRRSSDHGSIWTLGKNDQVIAVQRGRDYVEVPQ